MLEQTMENVTDEQARWVPPGSALPLAVIYAHIALGQDFIINVRLRGQTQLAATSHEGKTGLSEPPPLGPGWGEWARRVQIHLPPLREYARAVQENTNRYVSSLTEEDLDRVVELQILGPRTVASIISNFVVSHVNNHLGEISCLKGLQGAKGYPF
ncbi:MAG: DinB family protein [Chloroflexi bacterium]|nr:DinB family protein [Chloroflexota bacterium]